MASAVLERSDLYPVGTVVGCYKVPVPAPPFAPSGDPEKGQTKFTKAAEATVAANGKATLTGLTAGVRYVCWGKAQSEDHYLYITTAEAAAEGAVSSVNEETGAVVLTGAGISWSKGEASLTAEGVKATAIEKEAVTAAKIATNAVEEAKIKAKAVSESKLSAALVEKLPPAGGAAGELLARKGTTELEWKAGASGAPSGAAGGSLAGEYPNPTLGTGVVAATQLGAEAVTTAKIKLLAVEAGQLGAEAVTTAKLKLLAVEAGQLGAEAVTEAKIKGEAVTAGKIATDAVTEAKIKALAVTEGKLAAAVSAKLVVAGGEAGQVLTRKGTTEQEWKAASSAPTGAAGGALAGEYPNPTHAASSVKTAAIENEAVTEGKLAKAVVEKIEPKVMERSFAISGEVKNEVYPGFFVKMGTGEEKDLIGIEYELLEGTSVELELQKANAGKSEAAAGIASYKVTEAKAEKSTKRITATKALTNEDRITLKCSGGAGTPKGLICTLFIRSTK